MKFSSLPPAARQLWAKSGVPIGHGLLAHLLDVASVAETLLSREPSSVIAWIAHEFGLDPEHSIRWISSLVGLHDFGKGIGGFQLKWPEGMQAAAMAGLSFDQRSCEASNHSAATVALLGKGLFAKTGAKVAWIQHVLRAIGAHHGYHCLDREVRVSKPIGEPPAWDQARQAILDAYWETLAPEGRPTNDELSYAAVNWLAGLTSTADWIASNPLWFPFGERCGDLHDYFVEAKRLAAQACQSIGWPSYRPLLDIDCSVDELISKIVHASKRVTARPLQAVGDQLLRTADGPALLLVEAPMGEGKTELAMLAHLRLQEANRHRGMYMALPTQATGNAMFPRWLSFLQNWSAGEAFDIQLVHGAASMNEQVLRLREIDHSADQSVSASIWFSQRRRPLLSPYGVGTVDQALFATLNVKHHFVRIYGLANRLIVLDEVHAYDTYTLGLIEALLRWLKAVGSSVVLMSATLPRARRDALLDAWDVSVDAIPELPYPRIVLADRKGVRGESFASRSMAPIELSGIGEAVDAVADCALAQLSGGGCGAVIVNTVDRAQQLYRNLKARVPAETVLILFHARFPADERAEIERQVLSQFAPHAERPHEALLIATQVAEQSLDIDFDFMVTDLAPIDLILQRAGRLHRHLLPRPEGHRIARLFVAGLGGLELPDLKSNAWEYVYDPHILGRTWALLKQESVLQMPVDIDRLVQAVYGDAELPVDLPQETADRIELHWFGKYRARVNNEWVQSRSIALDCRDEPQNAYSNKPRGKEEGDGIGLENRTRLDADGVVVIPVHRGVDGWRLSVPGDVFDPQQLVGDELARRLYRRQVQLSHKAVARHFKQMEAPPSFDQHPLLRDFRPLVLSDGVCEIDSGLRISLDSELGVIIDKTQGQFLAETQV